MSEYANERRKLRQEVGLCMLCSENSVNKSYCAKHVKEKAEYVVERRNSFIDAKKCLRCGKTSTTRLYCAEHTAKYNLAQRIRRKRKSK